MKVLSFLRRFRRSGHAPTTDASRLAEAADALAETRTGPIVPGEPGPDATEGIANIVAAANDALFVDRSNEDRVLTDSADGYRRSR